MSDPKKISPLARKVLEVPTSLEVNFSTIEEGLHFSAGNDNNHNKAHYVVIMGRSTLWGGTLSVWRFWGYAIKIIHFKPCFS